MASLKARLTQAASGTTKLDFDVAQSDVLEPVRELLLSAIQPDPDQPRKNIGDVSELAESIKHHGVISPIIVAPLGKNSFKIIAGERRYTASKKAKKKKIPAIVRTLEEHETAEVQIIENLHRKDLTPIEEATSYKRLMSEFDLGQRELSKRLGKSAASINQTVRILDIPENILKSVQTSEHITKSVLLEIAKAPSRKAQATLAKSAINGKLTVKNARKGKVAAPKKSANATVSIQLDSAVVTIRFQDKKRVTAADRITVLKEALKAEQNGKK